jgi:hypothetical protein
MHSSSIWIIINALIEYLDRVINVLSTFKLWNAPHNFSRQLYVFVSYTDHVNILLASKSWNVLFCTNFSDMFMNSYHIHQWKIPAATRGVSSSSLNSCAFDASQCPHVVCFTQQGVALRRSILVMFINMDIYNGREGMLSHPYYL